jgi:hypothetical protein
MNMTPRALIRNIVLHAFFGLTLVAGNAFADKQYGPG